MEGARQILAAYKPTIRIDTKWPVVRLADLLKLASGDFLPEKDRRAGPHKVYGGNGVTGNHDKFNVDEPTIVIGRVGAYCGAVHMTEAKSWITDNALHVTAVLQSTELTYLAESLRILNLNQFAKVGGQPSISQTTVLEQTIPLPPLAIQRQIVSELEAERKLVETNRELIARMEAKIKAKLAEVWGETGN
jgi:type I restriction enzyme S subunit